MPDRDHDDDSRYDREDRPRRKGTPTGLIIGLVVGGVLALMLCVVGGLALLLVPAVGKVREAAGRAKDQNNLKEICLGMHNDHSASGRGFYAPYAHDEKGTIHKGHSYRVSLLPYINQDSLYRSIDLTQPYDSPRNSAQTGTVVPTYQSASNPEGNNTPYRAFVGGGALFNEDGKPVQFGEIKDGLSNTIMFVYAAESVPWAKPQELKYGRGIPLPALGHPSMSSGIPVAFADGSVRTMRPGMSEQTLRPLIEKADGQAVNLDW